MGAAADRRPVEVLARALGGEVRVAAEEVGEEACAKLGRDGLRGEDLVEGHAVVPPYNPCG